MFLPEKEVLILHGESINDILCVSNADDMSIVVLNAIVMLILILVIDSWRRK